jgi:hypothetical protein
LHSGSTATNSGSITFTTDGSVAVGTDVNVNATPAGDTSNYLWGGFAPRKRRSWSAIRIGAGSSDERAGARQARQGAGASSRQDRPFLLRILPTPPRPHDRRGQLAVDTEIEQPQFPLSAKNLKPDADNPNLPAIAGSSRLEEPQPDPILSGGRPVTWNTGRLEST